MALQWEVLRMADGIRESLVTVSEILGALAFGYAIYSLVAVVDFALERINLEILRRFNAEGIRFAFPSQTLYLENGGQGGLGVRILRDDARS